MSEPLSKSYCIENQVKQCSYCKKFLPLDKFGKKKSGFLGVKGQCKHCLNIQEKQRYNSSLEYKERKQKLTNKWRNENKERWSEISLKNKEARRLQKARRRAFRLALPHTFKLNEFKRLYPEIQDFSPYEIDHFIPLSWGHGGTTKENMCLLPICLNQEKSNRNPFEFRNTLSGDDLFYFDTVIKDMAIRNNLSVPEFKDYVNWCDKNRRSLAQIKEDGSKTSLDIWRESINHGIGNEIRRSNVG